jgi:hypothetical protein
VEDAVLVEDAGLGEEAGDASKRLHPAMSAGNIKRGTEVAG